MNGFQKGKFPTEESPSTKQLLDINIITSRFLYIYSTIRSFVPFTVNLVAQTIYLNAQNLAINLTAIQNFCFSRKWPGRQFNTMNYQHMSKITDVISIVMELEQF